MAVTKMEAAVIPRDGNLALSVNIELFAVLPILTDDDKSHLYDDHEQLDIHQV